MFVFVLLFLNNFALKSQYIKPNKTVDIVLDMDKCYKLKMLHIQKIKLYNIAVKEAQMFVPIKIESISKSKSNSLQNTSKNIHFKQANTNFFDSTFIFKKESISLLKIETDTLKKIFKRNKSLKKIKLRYHFIFKLEA